jgi:hypothetical protein
VADTGSYASDLRAFLTASYEVGNRPGFTDLLRSLMAEAQLSPEFGARFRAEFLDRRRDALAVITARARDRGDLPGQPAPEIAADIVFGTIWYRILATGEPLDPELTENLVTLLTRHQS